VCCVTAWVFCLYLVVCRVRAGGFVCVCVCVV
jgi:hypothetical protein